MCGIAGFCIAPGDRGHIDTARMTWSLGHDMQSRGSDATGICTVDARGRWKLRKEDIPAKIFLAGRKGIGENAQTVLLHTRAATHGSPRVMANNHPVVHGSIIGIHNGVIYNDDALFDHYDWKRNAEVDSEAIFAAINHLDLDKALTEIDGGWAISWIDINDDPRRLWLARGQSSPLCYALTENGTIVFASTVSAVEDAFKFGGITGKPNVIYAKEGFLAATDPDRGGIIILPEFDGSGKTATGHKPTAPRQTWNEYNTGSTVVPRTTYPTERVWITGDKKNPKVGDRRKYESSWNRWVFEVCVEAWPQGASRWQQLIGEGDRLVGGGTAPLHVVSDAEAFVPDPFEDEAYGVAKVGDIIKVEIDDWHASRSRRPCVVGKVTDIHADGAMSVSWYPGTVDKFSDYIICGSTPQLTEGAPV